MQRAGPPAAPAPTTRARILVGVFDLGKVQCQPRAKLADDLSARVLDRNDPELARLDPETGEEGGKRAPDRPRRSVLDLERDPEPVGRRGAHETLVTPLLHP